MTPSDKTDIIETLADFIQGLLDEGDLADIEEGCVDYLTMVQREKVYPWGLTPCPNFVNPFRQCIGTALRSKLTTPQIVASSYLEQWLKLQADPCPKEWVPYSGHRTLFAPEWIVNAVRAGVLRDAYYGNDLAYCFTLRSDELVKVWVTYDPTDEHDEALSIDSHGELVVFGAGEGEKALSKLLQEAGRATRRASSVEQTIVMLQQGLMPLK